MWLTDTLHHSAPRTLGRCMSKWKPGEMRGFLESTSERNSGLQIRPVKVLFETYLSGHLTHYPSHSLFAYSLQCNFQEFLSVLIIYVWSKDRSASAIIVIQLITFWLTKLSQQAAPLSTGGKSQRDSPPSEDHLRPEFSDPGLGQGAQWSLLLNFVLWSPAALQPGDDNFTFPYVLC